MSLRQEYIKNKISLHEARKAEVKDWLNENVVFLNERMDRARVKRLINLMLKFDQKFGPFKDKIPGITSIVSDAENALQMALSGRLSNARIGDIFQRLSVIYSILSDFFANDLKVLLQTPAFKVPRTKPEIRLDSITDSGYSPKHITDTFVLTLTPSEEEMVFLNKLYKGITLPQLDRHSIAGQMLGLSYKDLENLCGMEHVPMAVIPDENLLNEQGIVQGIKDVLSSAVTGAAGGSAVGGVTGSALGGIGASAGAAIGGAIGGISGAAKGLAANRAKNSPQVKGLMTTLNNLTKTAKQMKITPLDQALSKFRGRFIAAMTKGKDKPPDKMDSVVMSQGLRLLDFFKDIGDTMGEVAELDDSETLSGKGLYKDLKDKDAKQAADTLRVYIVNNLKQAKTDSLTNKLKGNLAKLGFKPEKSVMPVEFNDTVLKQIANYLVDLIGVPAGTPIAESASMRKIYENKNFLKEMQKQINEDLDAFKKLITNADAVETTINQTVTPAANAPVAAPGPGGKPTAQPQAAPAVAPGGGLKTGSNAFEKLDAGEIAFIKTMIENAKNAAGQQKAIYDPFIKNIETKIQGLKIEGGKITNSDQAITAVEELANTGLGIEKLNNLSEMTADDMSKISAFITKYFSPEKSISEQLPIVASLVNTVRQIDDLLKPVEDRIKRLPTQLKE